MTDKEEYDDTFKEFKRPQTQCSYVTLLSDTIDAEPSRYEEGIDYEETFASSGS